jgi:hypothetical protein
MSSSSLNDVTQFLTQAHFKNAIEGIFAKITMIKLYETLLYRTGKGSSISEVTVLQGGGVKDFVITVIRPQ